MDRNKNTDKLNIAMLGHKRIPSREGGIEIVVEELCTRMVQAGHNVTCLNRSGHHVSGKEFDNQLSKEYKGIRIKTVPSLNRKGLAAMTASVIGAICAAPIVLGACGLLQGKRATCYPGFEEELTGATTVVEPVVIDGNIVTSRGVGTALDFGLKILEVLTDLKNSEKIGTSILHY